MADEFLVRPRPGRKEAWRAAAARAGKPLASWAREVLDREAGDAAPLSDVQRAADAIATRVVATARRLVDKERQLTLACKDCGRRHDGVCEEG